MAAAIRGTPTKRQVAQISARIFDPIGFLAPVTVVAKMMFQKIWISKIDWDQIVTPDIQNDWNEFIRGLNSLSSLGRWGWVKLGLFNRRARLGIRLFNRRQW